MADPTPGAPCAEPAPPGLARALALFDAGDYFACHEVLEDLWRAETRPLRDLYKGVLMLAVALHHHRRGKRPLRPLTRAQQLLAPFTPACLGLDTATIHAACATLLTHLQTTTTQAPNHLVPQLTPLLRTPPR